jgi:elongation factor 2
MGRKEDNIRLAKDVMEDLDRVRNIDIAAHIDHGKTTLSDNLIAGAGMMSEELAGKQLALDFDPEEQARGITINAASASMVHRYKDKAYLINLIDTPGHVDFGGDVTRAMRAVDGCVIVCCAVEGPMPQTETVVRQALREKVKPVLFINKVDRLINELKVTPEQMQERFVKWITTVNRLIAKNVPAEFREKWKVNPGNGTVAFGSAYHNWAITVPYMQSSGITFKDIIEYNVKGDVKTLAKKAPLADVLLDMVIMRLPSPKEAQQYRIPHIWHGDQESAAGKAMMTTDSKGPVSFMVTKIIVDPHAGEVAFGRLYSGYLERGQELYVAGTQQKNRVQQVAMMVGADRVTVEKVTAGNIAAVTGLKSAMAGSTVTSLPDMEPFERIVHVSDPVVTKAVEAKHMKDLPKLVEVMRLINKGDPSLEVKIDQETGEHLMMGMGELHLEIIEHRITRDFGLEITTSAPLVVYRECVIKSSSLGQGDKGFEGKSPNKHNRFYFIAEPLDVRTVKAIHDGEVPLDAKKHAKEVEKVLTELGWDKDEARKVKHISGQNVLVDATKGIQYLFETMELVKEGIDEAMAKGPLAQEPVQGVKLILMDAKLHEDAVHRGPAQVIPAVRNGIYGAMVRAGRTVLEPMQKVVVDVPQDLMGDVTREIQQRRGIIEDMQGQDDRTVITAKAPVAEMFGFAGAIRSATQGRALWSTENLGFEPLDRNLLDKVTREVRERKGLKPEPYDEAYYAG